MQFPVYERILGIDPGNVNALYGKGLALFSKDQYEESLIWYDKVLAVDPNDMDALYGKGLAFYYLGEYQESINWYDKLQEIDPSYNNVSYAKGLALERLENAELSASPVQQEGNEQQNENLKQEQEEQLKQQQESIVKFFIFMSLPFMVLIGFIVYKILQ